MPPALITSACNGPPRRLLGETVVSEAEADVFLQRNLEVLDTVAAALAKEKERPSAVAALTGKCCLGSSSPSNFSAHAGY